MEYKYGGKSFTLRLDDHGMIENDDFGIKAKSVEEVKAKIREQVEKEKALPRVNVLFFERYGGNDKDHYLNGTSTLKDANTSRYGSYHEVWVSFKSERGGNEREKRYTTDIYLDTPENRKILDEYVAMQKQIQELREVASELLATVPHVQAIRVNDED